MYGRAVRYAVFLIGLVFAAGVVEAAARPNVLLITVDTLRADRLGCYGYALARTPNIDALADEGVLFDDATTTAPITMPAHASIMTGLLPPAHGVRDNGAYMLADEHWTLAEAMKDHGYRTGAFVSAVVLGRRYNLVQGFDVYDDALWAEDEPRLFMIRDRPANRTAEKAIAWLEQVGAKSDAPFFLWVHFFDPHQPYESRYAKRHLLPTLYDAEIAQVDEAVGQLVGWLKANNKFDNTISVLTADHGESLGEHGEKTHAIFVYDATIRVPLIVRYPGALSPGRYKGPASCIDIFPTLRALSGISDTTQVQGIDLSQALRGLEAPPLQRPQYAESLLSEVGFGMAPLYAVRANRMKWIRAPKPERYDLDKDPKELTNLVSASDAVNAEMDAMLQSLIDDSAKFARGKASNPLDRETLDALRAMGYVATDRARADASGMDPKDGLALYAKLEDARHAAQRSEFAVAEKLLREVLAQAPGHVTARNVLGLVLMRQNRLADAEAEYRRSLETDPAQARVLYMLGVVAVRQKDPAKAREHCELALAHAPHLVEAMVILGFLSLQEGKHEEASAWYARAIEADPAMPRAHNAYADLYYLQGAYAEALVHYRKVLDATPDHFSAHIQAGLCAQRLKEGNTASAMFEKARALRPDSWLPPYNLACAAALAGENVAAVALLKEAVSLAPADVAIARIAREDEDFSSLRDVAAFRELLASAEKRPRP